MSDSPRSLRRLVILAGIVALPPIGALPVAAHGAQEPAGAPQTVLTDMMDAATGRSSESDSVRRGSGTGAGAGGISWILWGSLATSLGAAGILLAAIVGDRPKERTSATGGPTTTEAPEVASPEAADPSKAVPRDRPVPARPAFPVSQPPRRDAAGSYETTAGETDHAGATAEEEDASQGSDDADRGPAPAPASNPYATPKPTGPSVDHWIPRCGPEG